MRVHLRTLAQAPTIHQLAYWHSRGAVLQAQPQEFGRVLRASPESRQFSVPAALFLAPPAAKRQARRVLYIGKIHYQRRYEATKAE